MDDFRLAAEQGDVLGFAFSARTRPFRWHQRQWQQ
jgi:hypothetical protein